MGRLRFWLATSGLLLGTALMAQTVAIIDTRGQQPSTPSVRRSGGTGSDSTAESKSLRLALAIDSPRLKVGQSFAYELLVTNTSDKPVMIPQSTSWPDVVDDSKLEQEYQQVAVSFSFLTDEGKKGSVDGHLALYGAEAKPEIMIRLAPGEAVRIQGSASMSPAWITTPAATPTKATLQAYLAVNVTELRPAKSTNSSFRDNERHLYWAQSDDSVEIELLGRNPR